MLSAMRWHVVQLWLSLLLLALPGVAQTPPPAEPRTGWVAGSVAIGTVEMLTPNEPVQLDLPGPIADRITGPTALFYFSPTCPHCQHAAPEIAKLAQMPGLTWIGVATGSSQARDLDAFRAAFGLRIDIVVDVDRGFARALGASSTPSVYVVQPLPQNNPVVESANAAVARSGGDTDLLPVLLTDAWLPWHRGAGGILRLRLHPEDPFRDFQGYQTDTTCGACHSQEAQSWALTHHSVAYRTLQTRDRLMDLECVGCHVTGLDQPGGFVMGDHSSPLADVTCEACHGPSGPHDGQPTDPREVCTTCHDAKHSVNFSVEKGLPHLDHFVITTMDEAAVRARLDALWEGEAERPLLAFAEGPTVGAAACKSCHADEHKDWKKDPHSDAMSLLAPHERGDPGCVSCHATATAVTPPGQPPTSWRTDEGVGCESCHGPGGAHVAEPRADNIIGLGESCPECVIESICTSCHTPRWDPNWELKPRLAGARHD